MKSNNTTGETGDRLGGIPVLGRNCDTVR